MKKILLLVTMLLVSVFVFQPQVSAIGGCDVGPQFCFEDPGDGGTGTYPDNYLVDTGLVATIVLANGYLVDTYNIYVRANEVAVDLNTSDLFFKKYPTLTTYYTDDYIIQRDPTGGITSGGSYWLAQGVTKTTFEQNSQYVGVSLTGYTVLVQANWGGKLYMNYGQSNQSIRNMQFGYYNAQTDAVMVCETNGMNGSFGKFVFAKRVTPTSYSNFRVLGWTLNGASYFHSVSVLTSYSSYNSVPMNTNKADLINVIVVNR